MTKIERALQEHKSTKIVIGNGFDLFCGLKTTYRDFFVFFQHKYAKISKWIDEAVTRLYNNPDLKTDPWPLVVQFEYVDLINCWDVYFAMISDKSHDHRWCDIESEMLDSLSLRDSDVESEYKPHWENVWESIIKDRMDEQKAGSIIIAQFILKKTQRQFMTKDEFYEYLLKELREFESHFGSFIIKQHVVKNQFLEDYNLPYIRKAHSLFEQFCEPGFISSIDCFNYAFTPESKFYERCRFINGNCLNPIFGVDSVFDPSDARYIFTKTNRRLEWWMDKKITIRTDDFENVIVFGHSLSQHDYNYFFPILDQLEMTDFGSTKKFIIAYSVYDEQRSAGIKKEIRKSIYSLFFAYAEYCGKGNQAARLLDSLTTQGRVRMFEVEKLPEPTKFFSRVDETYQKELSDKEIADRWANYLKYGEDLFL